MSAHGEMPEWLNGALSKSVNPSRDSGVRIPLSPLKKTSNTLVFLFLVMNVLTFDIGLSRFLNINPPKR